MSAVDLLLAHAIAEEGYLEKETNSQLDNKTANAGNKNWTKYARDLDALGVYNGKKNGYAWCDQFVDWNFIALFGLAEGLKATFQTMGGYGAGCTNSAQYYRNVSRFYKTGPQRGDQIFFTNDGGKTMVHTGLVTKVSGGRVYTIEGNTSSAAGVVANGGCVRQKSYLLTYERIGGYGRPDYAYLDRCIAEKNKKEETDLPNIEDLTTQQCEALWAKITEPLRDNDVNEYSKPAREWCIENGVIAGTGGDTPNYQWAAPLTREQFCTMLYRFAKLIGKA